MYLHDRYRREKRDYREGDKIAFDVDGVNKGLGVICGKSMTHVIDFWIVRVEQWDKVPTEYPYSCVVLPHSAIWMREA